MMTPIDTQTLINETYRTAIVSVLEAQNGPVTREELNTLLLGGTVGPEVERLIVEPYVPALAQLVISGVICQCGGRARDESEEDSPVTFLMREKATYQQRAESSARLLTQKNQNYDQWNNPTLWRKDLDDAVEDSIDFRKFVVASFMAEMGTDTDLAEVLIGTVSGVVH